MAQTLKLELPPRDPRKELMERLERAPEDHAAAILDGYELIQQLHDHGVFHMLQGAIGAGDKIIESVAAGTSKPEAIRAMRNAIILAKMLGSIDPQFLESTAASVQDTFSSVRNVPSRPPGLFSLLFGFASRDVRGLLTLLRTFLASLAGRLKLHGSNDAAG